MLLQFLLADKNLLSCLFYVQVNNFALPNIADVTANASKGYLAATAYLTPTYFQINVLAV